MIKMNDVIDLIQEQDEYASFILGICLWKSKWLRYSLTDKFEWRTLSFKYCNRREIPRKPGIYSFVINPTVAQHPQRYLCYIGKSDNLQRRYEEYLREAENNYGRPKIVRVLKKWEGFMEFSFTLLEKSRLENVENYLIKTFVPYANDQYPAQVSRVVGAFK